MRRALDWVGRKMASAGVLLTMAGVAIRVLAAPRKPRQVSPRPPREVRKEWGPS